MGWLGSAIGAIGSVAGSLINAHSARKENAKNREFSLEQMQEEQRLNKEYAQWSAKALPALNRQGMEKAGFNPLLALTAGTGEQGHISGSSPNTQVPQLDVSSISSALSGIDSTRQKDRMIDNAEKLQGAQIDSLEHQSAKNDADAVLALEQAKLADSQRKYTDTQNDLYGLANPVTASARFGRDVLKPIGEFAFKRLTNAGNKVGDYVVNSASGVVNRVKDAVRNAWSESGKTWRGESNRPLHSPRQDREENRGRPRETQKPKYKIRGHW